MESTLPRFKKFRDKICYQKAFFHCRICFKRFCHKDMGRRYNIVLEHLQKVHNIYTEDQRDKQLSCTHEYQQLPMIKLSNPPIYTFKCKKCEHQRDVQVKPSIICFSSKILDALEGKS